MQAILMSKRGLSPSNVLMLNVPVEEVYRRTEPFKVTDFGCDRTILSRRINYLAQNLPMMAFHYQKYYNSVTNIDGTKSRWYMQDLALDALQRNLTARMNFVRDYYFGSSDQRPCVMADLHIDRCLFKQSISQFGYFCPVSWKVHKKYVSCAAVPEHCVLHQQFFYYFASAEARDVFCKNPERFTQNVLFSSERNIPRRYRPHKCAELVAQEKALIGHCPVTLKDEQKIKMGQAILIVEFKEHRFVFVSEEKAQKFFADPARYASVTLPVKMPPPKDPVSLHWLQKQEDQITFME